MEVTKEIIQGLVVLLPGFVTAGVIRALYVGESENDFDKVVKSLIFSFVDYVAYTFFIWLSAYIGVRVYLPFFFRKNEKVDVSNLDILSALPSQPSEIVALFIISITVGILIAFYKANDGHKWFFRKCGVTHRTTRHNVWHDVFSDFGKNYVIANLEDGRRIFGWPLHYNDDAKEPYLFLSEAEWLSVNDKGEEQRTPIGDIGILLLPSMKVASVEFFTSPAPDNGNSFWQRAFKWRRQMPEEPVNLNPGDAPNGTHQNPDGTDG